MVCASVWRDNPRALACTMISSVDLGYYRVPRAKDWVSVDCGAITITYLINHIGLIVFTNKRVRVKHVRGQGRFQGHNYYNFKLFHSICERKKT